MSYYVAVTGKLGSGKGLCSIGRMIQYLKRGKPVITNMDIFPENFADPYNDKTRIYRVPDHPSSEDIKMCGTGNDTYDPEENGVAILDELATWFNSHDWNSPKAKQLNDLLVHLRKLGWDGIFQVQSLESMNSQARRNIITSEARCQKIRQVHVPIITFLIRTITGISFKLPRSWMFHTMTQSSTESGLVEIKERYKGTTYWPYYNTAQIFDSNYPHGTFCYLTPWHLKGRYMKPKVTFFKKVKLCASLPLLAAFFIASFLSGDDLEKLGVIKKSI